MDVLDRSAEQAPASAPRRRRKWLRILVTSLLVLMAAFGASAGAFVANYQPLDASGLLSGVSPPAIDLGSFTSPRGETFDAYIVKSAQTGQRFRFGFTISNGGPVAVTVERVAPPYAQSGVATPLILQSIRIGPAEGPNQFQITGGEPFHPFRLAPDGDEYVEFENTFANCRWGTQGELGFSQFEVTYRVFGITRHTTVYPGYTIGFRVSICPLHWGTSP